MKIVDAQEKSLVEQQLWTRRRMATAGMLGMATVFVSGCIGGSGDSSDDDVDLRAMYDRIHEGMTHEEVSRVIGYQPQTASDATRIWDSGSQHLNVSFSRFDGIWVTVGVLWWTSSGQELTKTF